MSEDAPPIGDDQHAAEATGRGHLVVIGASAGGVEAFSTLVSGLRPDFPAPLVLAQHLDPSQPSHLHSILQRRTSLPVQVVEGRSSMQPGTIYVVPANSHVLIQEGRVALADGHVDHPRPSIDLLLTTAAQSYGDRLIAVVLTGAGSDGAAGAVDVKHAGGTVIIQNPMTARFPSMPSAVPTTAVDHVAHVENIAGLLDVLVRVRSSRSRTPLETTNDELAARTSELQEMARQLTLEKARLAEMIELAPFHMLLLRGPDLVIEGFSPSCGRLFNLEGALNRRLEDVLPEARELLAAIRTAYRNDVMWESPDPGLKQPGSSDGDLYRVTIVPRHEEGRVDGVVVYAEGAAPVPRRRR